MLTFMSLVWRHSKYVIYTKIVPHDSIFIALSTAILLLKELMKKHFSYKWKEFKTERCMSMLTLCRLASVMSMSPYRHLTINYYK